jgi:DNA polymerase III epsilon subunit family exonuclease
MEPIEAEDAPAAPGQMGGGGAPDGAEPGEDDVVGHGDNLASGETARDMTEVIAIATPSEQQRRAIEAPPGPVLVLAGPGAGKTFCLIERVRALVERHGADPGRICAITFTNKAAEEIAARLHRDLGPASEAVHRGTIHSLCAEILREHGERIGIPRGFGIADEDTQDVVLRRLGVHVFKRRMWLLNQFGRHRLQGTPLEPDVATLCRSYLEMLRARRLVDFDDLVLLADALFGAEPEVARAIAARWDHLLVDEFQDLNAPQYRIVRRLVEDHRSVFAVGDDEQSIFSWTGADPRVLDRFRTDFATPEPITLEENHRCSRAIFAVARRLVERNTPLFPRKHIVAVRDVPVPVVARAFSDEGAEADWIVADVLASRAAGVPWGEIGVLYRVHEIGKELEQAFVRAGIPCRLARGHSLTDDPVIAQVLASLRVIREDGDSLAAEALALRVFPEQLLERIRAAVPAEGGDFLAGVREVARRAPQGDPDRRLAWRFVYQVENLRALARTHESLPALILEILGSRMGQWRNTLEERAEDLADPADDPDAVALATALEDVIAREATVWIPPLGGAEIGVRGLLVRSEIVQRVRYLLSDEEPGAGDFVLAASAGAACLALRVFKALQLLQTRALADPFPEYVAFDFETTDKDASSCDVVEIGAVRVAGGRVVEEFHSLVRPARPISQRATEVHGYTAADLEGAPPFAQAWPSFRAFVGNHVLLAHNAQKFDVPVLLRLARGLPGVESLRFFDSLPVARALITDGSAKLEALADRFGIDKGREHHALDDARTLAAVYDRLARLQQARARKTAQVQLLDCLGLSLAGAGTPGPEASGEEKVLRELVPAFTLGRYSDALEFYAAERDRVPELSAPPVEEIIDRLGGRAKMERLRRTPSPEDRYAVALARLEALVGASAADTLADSIGLLLERVALSTSHEAETDPERVNLLTLHSTKGLEYSLVYVVGVEDDRLPGVRAAGDEGVRETEEARRLLYVGMTRAMDRLVLTRVAERFKKSAGGSLFLEEMGLET